MDKRDTCIFYRSIFESIQELPKEQQADIYNAVFEFCLNFKEIELSGISKTIFNLVKPVLSANNSRYVNGSRPKTNKYSKPKANQKRNKSEEEPNEELNKSEDKAYKYKYNNNYKNWSKDDLINSIKESVASCVYEDKYTPSLLRDFFNYWSEVNSNNKMRFQLEKTWETNKRLVTWKNNNSKWSKDSPNKKSVDQKSRSERGVKI